MTGMMRLLVLSAALAGALAGLPGRPAAAQAAASAPRSSAPPDSEARELTLPATVAPYQQVTLMTRLSGYVKSISVEPGDRVKKGQVIAQIEAPELLADRAQYRAEVDVARANLDRLNKAIQTAPDLVSGERVDEAKAQLQIAEARLQGVETRLAFGAITAPFAGVVTERRVDPGAFVQANAGGDASVVISMMDFRRVRVQVRVPEKEAPFVKPGLPARITSTQLPGRKIEGSVTRVAYALDPASRMMLSEIELDNRDETLRPGMLVSVALALPKSAGASKQ